jgi:hypothetical protein
MPHPHHEEPPHWVCGIIEHLERGESRLVQLHNQIHNQEITIMSALTDLQGAVTSLATAVADEITAVTTALTALGDNVSASDVETAVTSINATVATLQAETAKLAPPPPTPAP